MPGKRALLAEHLVTLVAGEHAFFRGAVALGRKLALLGARVAWVFVIRWAVIVRQALRIALSEVFLAVALGTAGFSAAVVIPVAVVHRRRQHLAIPEAGGVVRGRAVGSVAAVR